MSDVEATTSLGVEIVVSSDTNQGGKAVGRNGQANVGSALHKETKRKKGRSQPIEVLLDGDNRSGRCIRPGNVCVILDDGQTQEGRYVELCLANWRRLRNAGETMPIGDMLILIRDCDLVPLPVPWDKEYQNISEERQDGTWACRAWLNRGTYKGRRSG